MQATAMPGPFLCSVGSLQLLPCLSVTSNLGSEKPGLPHQPSPQLTVQLQCGGVHTVNLYLRRQQNFTCLVPMLNFLLSRVMILPFFTGSVSCEKMVAHTSFLVGDRQCSSALRCVLKTMCLCRKRKPHDPHLTSRLLWRARAFAPSCLEEHSLYPAYISGGSGDGSVGKAVAMEA